MPLLKVEHGKRCAEQMNPPIAALADSTLIKMVLSGRTECFAVLMNRYLPMVRRRIGSIAANIADVEDLSQEVFFKTWQHLSTFREESSFGTWVTRIAINEALTLCRKITVAQTGRPSRIWTRSHRRSTRLFNAWLEGKRDKCCT